MSYDNRLDEYAAKVKEGLAMWCDMPHDVVDDAVRLLAEADLVVVTGVGKSYLVAELWAGMLRSAGVHAWAEHSVDLQHGQRAPLLARRKSVLVALSFSGETDETQRAVAAGKSWSATVILVCRRAAFGEKSGMRVLADLVLWLPREVDHDAHGECVSFPVVSTTLMVHMAGVLARAVMRFTGRDKEWWRAAHPGGAIGEALNRRS